MSISKGDVSTPPEGVLEVTPVHTGAQVLHLQPVLGAYRCPVSAATSAATVTISPHARGMLHSDPEAEEILPIALVHSIIRVPIIFELAESKLAVLDKDISHLPVLPEEVLNILDPAV